MKVNNNVRTFNKNSDEYCSFRPNYSEVDYPFDNIVVPEIEMSCYWTLYKNMVCI